MVKKQSNCSLSGRGREFLVYGRVKASEGQTEPQITVIKVVAPNTAFAKSKFWKIMRTQNKIKKSLGEVLKIQEVFGQKKVEAKNFGIYLKYHTHVGDKNMFKEYRAESIQSALDQMYNEMGGNYRVSRDRVEVIKTVELTEE